MVVHSVGVVTPQALPGSSDTGYDKLLAYAVFVDEQRRRSVHQLHTESLQS